MGSITDYCDKPSINDLASDSSHVKKDVTDAEALRAERVVVQIKSFSIHGFKSQQSQVSNFRNIQYARIPSRWQQAVLVDPTKEVGVIDATQWGPRCPQPVDVLHDATRHLYPRMSTFDRQSEFDCLNLNVYTPTTALRNKHRGLPVLVWIHGGAFVYGDGGCEFDGQYLVQHSIGINEPIVIVGINYRLGVLGIFSSKALQGEARERGEVGLNNLSLHDQRLGLQWVQQNVHHFGGDGSRITVAGESAGACSILAHLRGRVPVFHNAFIMSPATVTPASFSDAQRTYDQLVSAVGLENAPAGVQLSYLRSMSPKQIADIIGGNQHMMIEDDEFFSEYSGERFEQLSIIPSWVKGVVVGQTKQESVLFSQKWHTMSSEDMYDRWMSLYDDKSYAQEVCAAYRISRTSSHQDAIAAIVAYTSDVLFGVATQSIATRHLQKQHRTNPKVYLYSFDQPDILSPNKVFHGSAYHSMDNSFLFRHPQVAAPSAPAEFRATADIFSHAALALINDREPWEDIGASKCYMSILGQSSGIKKLEDTSAPLTTLTDTNARYAKFASGRALLMEAMAYAMTLPVDVHNRP